MCGGLGNHYIFEISLEVNQIGIYYQELQYLNNHNSTAWSTKMLSVFCQPVTKGHN